MYFYGIYPGFIPCVNQHSVPLGSCHIVVATSSRLLPRMMARDGKSPNISLFNASIQCRYKLYITIHNNIISSSGIYPKFIWCINRWSAPLGSCHIVVATSSRLLPALAARDGKSSNITLFNACSIQVL